MVHFLILLSLHCVTTVSFTSALTIKKLHRFDTYRVHLEKSSSGGKVRWFGEDGRLVALPDPILKRPTRPPNLDESDAPVEPDTFFCPPFFGVQSATDEITYGKFSGGITHCQLDASLQNNDSLY